MHRLTTPSRPTSRLGAALSLELLEPRAMLSVDLSGGVLTIEGTNRADLIEVSKDPDSGQLVAELNGATYSFDLATVQQIHINAGSGHDTVSISDDISIDATVSGGSGRDQLHGGGGNDLIHGDQSRDMVDGGDGDDDIFGDASSDWVLGGSGDDTCHGGTGNDQLDGEDGNDLLDGDLGRDREEHGLSVDLDVEFEALLQSAIGVVGEAEFEMEQEDDGLEVEFKLEVEHATPDSVFDVLIDNVVVGQLSTDSSGRGCLRFSNDPDDSDELAFPTLFPEIHAGSKISIGTQASGIFQAEAD